MYCRHCIYMYDFQRGQRDRRIQPHALSLSFIYGEVGNLEKVMMFIQYSEAEPAWNSFACDQLYCHVCKCYSVVLACMSRNTVRLERVSVPRGKTRKATKVHFP